MQTGTEVIGKQLSVIGTCQTDNLLPITVYHQTNNRTGSSNKALSVCRKAAPVAPSTTR